MLERKITDILLEWKKEDKKPCLLIRGARQVGKTFIIDDFAKKNYENYIQINFELTPEQIATRHSKLMYYERKSTLEIDFILNIDGKVTAIEVKSGKNKQAKSLKSIVQNYKTLTRYMKFEKDCNVYMDEEKIEHYPLFMIMFI